MLQRAVELPLPVGREGVADVGVDPALDVESGFAVVLGHRTAGGVDPILGAGADVDREAVRISDPVELYALGDAGADDEGADSLTDMATAIVRITAGNAPPALDLDDTAAGNGALLLYTEGDGAQDVAPNTSLTDPDSDIERDPGTLVARLAQPGALEKIPKSRPIEELVDAIAKHTPGDATPGRILELLQYDFNDEFQKLIDTTAVTPHEQQEMQGKVRDTAAR